MEMTSATLNFILEHAHEDVASLYLKYAGKTLPDVDIPLAIMQIEARVKARAKLPWLASMPGFVFPSPLAAEQCTAQPVADFHAEVAGAPGSLLDLTCGLAIDLAAMAGEVHKVEACDISEMHVRCAEHNLPLLGVRNARLHCCEAGAYLAALPHDEHFDLIFADPARRTSDNHRTYALSDCSPDILALLPRIRRHTDRLLVKVSPMLDVTALLGQLPEISDIYAVSLHGECKELLLDCHLDEYQGQTRLHTVQVEADGFEVFDLRPADAPEDLLPSGMYPTPGQYLAEPGPALMKYVGKVSVTEQWPGLKKLGVNTHLYISERKPEYFPGRVLRLEEVLPYQKKSAGCLPTHINVVTRNFPDSPQAVKKKLRLVDGGEEFLYCCRLGEHEAVLLHCSKT